ncbi:MAG: hypothetical protein WD225_11640 [Ilumatobacteraceae bacterium]
MSEPTDHGGNWGWYWDLGKNAVVRWDERGPGDQVLGPYPSPEAAANWRSTVERRNEAWDEEDEAWDEWGETDGGDGGDADGDGGGDRPGRS